MPTSRLATKCPIEVGVASEVRNAANPDIYGRNARLTLEADLSSAYEKMLRKSASIPGSPQLQEAAKYRLK